MPRDFWIAELQISEPVEQKLRDHRGLTGDQVRQACIPDAYDEAGWEEHPEHGRRLLVICETWDGISLKVILQPVDANQRGHLAIAYGVEV